MHADLAAWTALEVIAQCMREVMGTLEGELEEFRQLVQRKNLVERPKCENICKGILVLAQLQDKMGEYCAKYPEDLGVIPLTVDALEKSIKAGKEKILRDDYIKETLINTAFENINS